MTTIAILVTILQCTMLFGTLSYIYWYEHIRKTYSSTSQEGVEKRSQGRRLEIP